MIQSEGEITRENVVDTPNDNKNIYIDSVSESSRQSVLEELENEWESNAYNKGIAEYRMDSETFTLDEVEKELGLV